MPSRTTAAMPPLSAVPKPALVLGLAGLIPFYLAGFGIWLFSFPLALWLLDLQIYYGAVILSFLGAVHWGWALGRDPAELAGVEGWNRLGWSGLPALLGWLALLAPQVVGVTILILGLGAAYLADHRAVRQGLFAVWYLPLRRLLTLGAVAALVLGLARFLIVSPI